MKAKPNIVIIKTDQQRADTIAALGNDHMITPNMDKLVQDGVSFTNAFCCGATCVSSRAAFYTGRYAHNTGVYEFNNWSHQKTWLHDLKEAGYHLSAVGKVHHQPMPEFMAFDERIIAENFPMFTDYDDYSNYLKAENQPDPCKLLTQDGKWLDKCCSDEFPLAEKYFVDNFVGKRAVNWIDSYSKNDPFFLQIGFVGPHDPFAPPKRFIDMYKDREVPEPIVSGDGYAAKPPQFKRLMEQCINPPRFKVAPGYGVYQIKLDDKTSEQITNMRKHYYARITAIDEQIGHIMQALQQKDLLENTIIILTSDHGDNLGDHGMMYKWVMTEQSTRVPLIVRLPSSYNRSGVIDDKLFSQMDIGPTLLDFADKETSCYLDGTSNFNRIVNGDLSEVPAKVYCEDNYLTMIRTETDKMVYYAGQDHGEYYDLVNDPHELENLYGSNSCQDRIKQLKFDLLDWLSTSRYLGSTVDVGLAGKSERHWPDNHPEDPYILIGEPRPNRHKL